MFPPSAGRADISGYLFRRHAKFYLIMGRTSLPVSQSSDTVPEFCDLRAGNRIVLVLI